MWVSCGFQWRRAAENEKLRRLLAEQGKALEEEKGARYTVEGDMMKKNGIPYAVRSGSEWVPLGTD